MKISTKIYLGFGVVTFLTLLLGFFMVISLNEMATASGSTMASTRFDQRHDNAVPSYVCRSVVERQWVVRLWSQESCTFLRRDLIGSAQAATELCAFGDSRRTRARHPAIYRLLEEDIVPLYYKQDEDGIPHDWVKIMKEAIKSTGPHFSARRMVKEYAEKFYRHALQPASSGM